MVLICIPLMISDAEHLSTCLLAICIASLGKNVYSGPLPFFNQVAWGFLLCFLIN